MHGLTPPSGRGGAARQNSLGRGGFVERHGLWSDAQAAAAERVIEEIERRKLELVRLSFPDQHGILRGKAVVADVFKQTLKNGVAMVSTLLAKDTSHRTVYPWFTKGGGMGLDEMTGGGDFLMVPDPTCFHVLPWAPDSGWVLCDIFFDNGKRVPFSTRHILRDAIERLEAQGRRLVAGLEMEFHIFKLEDAKLQPEHATQPAVAPGVSLVTRGFQHLTDVRFDEMESIIGTLRRQIVELGLPLRSVELEFGPTQGEFTFHPGEGLETADAAVLFRTAAKQICRRNGYHITFMCQPGLPNLFPSGWHLHQSMVDTETGHNLFEPQEEGALLSPLGRQFAAGILEHARAASVFTTPTINGYKRYKPNSLAPDRATWGRDNRGVMLRVLGGKGDPGTRLENRIGDPAANPYLYMASQILAGMDGIERGLEPPEPADQPYETDAEPLPRNLMDAVAALKDDAFFRGALGDRFVDYIVYLKEQEIARFLSTVTDWEQNEYFEIF